MLTIRQTIAYATWFKKLRDERAKDRIAVRIRRLQLGHVGDAKAVGGGVRELRIDYGPGYRVYSCSAARRSFSCSVEATRAAKQRTSRTPKRSPNNGPIDNVS
jgi:putative addiction module killer protein